MLPLYKSHTDVEFAAFVELVNSSNGTTQKQKESENTRENPKAIKTSKRGEKKNVSLVPSQFIQTDVSDIKGKTSIFSNMIFCILSHLFILLIAFFSLVIFKTHFYMITPFASLYFLDESITDFANLPRSHSLDTFHKMVVENGGKFSMNLNNSVTHCIAAESSGNVTFILSYFLYKDDLHVRQMRVLLQE